MSVLLDFPLNRFEDGVFVVSMSPPQDISNWSLRFFMQHRFGGVSGLIQKYAASGYGGGVSGITITNSGQGVFNIAFRSVDTSGLEYGNYAYTVERTESGHRQILTEGYMNILPGTIP